MKNFSRFFSMCVFFPIEKIFQKTCFLRDSASNKCFRNHLNNESMCQLEFDLSFLRSMRQIKPLIFVYGKLFFGCYYMSNFNLNIDFFFTLFTHLFYFLQKTKENRVFVRFLSFLEQGANAYMIMNKTYIFSYNTLMNFLFILTI